MKKIFESTKVLVSLVICASIVAVAGVGAIIGSVVGGKKATNTNLPTLQNVTFAKEFDNFTKVEHKSQLLETNEKSIEFDMGITNQNPMFTFNSDFKAYDYENDIYVDGSDGIYSENQDEVGISPRDKKIIVNDDFMTGSNKKIKFEIVPNLGRIYSGSDADEFKYLNEELNESFIYYISSIVLYVDGSGSFTEFTKISGDYNYGKISYSATTFKYMNLVLNFTYDQISGVLQFEVTTTDNKGLPCNIKLAMFMDYKNKYKSNDVTVLVNDADNRNFDVVTTKTNGSISYLFDGGVEGVIENKTVNTNSSQVLRASVDDLVQIKASNYTETGRMVDKLVFGEKVLTGSGGSATVENKTWFTIYAGLKFNDINLNDRYLFGAEATSKLVGAGILNEDGRLVGASSGETWDIVSYNGFAYFIEYENEYTLPEIGIGGSLYYGKFTEKTEISGATGYEGLLLKVNEDNILNYKHKMSIQITKYGELIIKKVDMATPLFAEFTCQDYYIIKLMSYSSNMMQSDTRPFEKGEVEISNGGEVIVSYDGNNNDGTVVNPVLLKTYAEVGGKNYNLTVDIVLDAEYLWYSSVDQNFMYNVTMEDGLELMLGYRESNFSGGVRELIAYYNLEGVDLFKIDVQLDYKIGDTPHIAYSDTEIYTKADYLTSDYALNKDPSSYPEVNEEWKKSAFAGSAKRDFVVGKEDGFAMYYVNAGFRIVLSAGFYIESMTITYENGDGYSNSIGVNEMYDYTGVVELMADPNGLGATYHKSAIVKVVAKAISVNIPIYVGYDVGLNPDMAKGAVALAEAIEYNKTNKNSFMRGYTDSLKVVYHLYGNMVITPMSDASSKYAVVVEYRDASGKKIGAPAKVGYHYFGAYLNMFGVDDGEFSGIGGLNGNQTFSDKLKYNCIEYTGIKLHGPTNKFLLYIDGAYYDYAQFTRYVKDYYNLQGDELANKVHEIWGGYFSLYFSPSDGSGEQFVNYMGKISGEYSDEFCYEFTGKFDDIKGNLVAPDGYANIYEYLNDVYSYILTYSQTSAMMSLFNADCLEKQITFKNYEYDKTKVEDSDVESITMTAKGYIYYDTVEMNLEEIVSETRILENGNPITSYSTTYFVDGEDRINYGELPVKCTEHALEQWPKENPVYMHRGYRLYGFDTARLSNLSVEQEIHDTPNEGFVYSDPSRYLVDYDGNYTGVATYYIRDAWKNVDGIYNRLFVRVVKINYNMEYVAVNNVYRVEREESGVPVFGDNGYYTVNSIKGFGFDSEFVIGNLYTADDIELDLKQYNIFKTNGVLGKGDPAKTTLIENNYTRGYKLLGFVPFSLMSLPNAVTDDSILLDYTALAECFGMSEQEIKFLEVKVAEALGRGVSEFDVCKYYLDNLYYLINENGDFGFWSKNVRILEAEAFKYSYLRDVRLVPVFEVDNFSITLSAKDTNVPQVDANFGTILVDPTPGDDTDEPVEMIVSIQTLNYNSNSDIQKYVKLIKMNEKVENFLVMLGDGREVPLFDLLFFAPSYIQNGYYFAGYRYYYKSDRYVAISADHTYDATNRAIVYENSVGKDLIGLIKDIDGLVYVSEDGELYWDIYADVMLQGYFEAFPYNVTIGATNADGEVSGSEGVVDFIADKKVTVVNNFNGLVDVNGLTLREFRAIPFDAGNPNPLNIYYNDNIFANTLYVFNTLKLKQLCVVDEANLGEGKYISNGVYVQNIVITFTTVYGDELTQIVELKYATDMVGLPIIVGYQLLEGDALADIDAEFLKTENLLNFDFVNDEFYIDFKLLADANNTIKDINIDFIYAYKTYVLNFTAGLINPSLEVMDESSLVTQRYLVTYNTRSDPRTWVPCNELGFADGEAGWKNLVVDYNAKKTEFGIETLERTVDIDITFDKKARFFAYWARDLGDPELEPPYEELGFLNITSLADGTVDGMSIDNVFDSESGGTFNYMTIFVDVADINVHYYTWNPNYNPDVTDGYEITAHKGYFWGNVSEFKSFNVVNAYELYEIGGKLYYICGWLKIEDNIYLEDDEVTPKINLNSTYLASKHIAVDARTGALITSGFVPNDLEYIWAIDQQIDVPRRDTVNIEEINIKAYAVYARYDFDVYLDNEGTLSEEYRVEAYVPNDVEGNSYINYPGNGGFNTAETSVEITFAVVDSIEYESLLGKFTSIKSMVNSGELKIKFEFVSDASYDGGNIVTKAYVGAKLNIGDMLIAYFKRPSIYGDGGDVMVPTIYDENGKLIPGRNDDEIFEGVLIVGSMQAEGFKFKEYQTVGAYADGTYIGALDENIKLSGSFLEMYAEAINSIKDLNNKDVEAREEFKRRELIIRIALQIAQWDNAFNYSASEQMNYGVIYTDVDKNFGIIDGYNGKPGSAVDTNISLTDCIELLNSNYKKVKEMDNGALYINSLGFVKLVYAIAGYSINPTSPEVVYGLFGTENVTDRLPIFNGGVFDGALNAGDILVSDGAGGETIYTIMLCKEVSNDKYMVAGVRNYISGVYTVGTYSDKLVGDWTENAIIHTLGGGKTIKYIYYANYIKIS